MSEINRLQAFRKEISDACAEIEGLIKDESTSIEDACSCLVDLYNIKKDVSMMYEEIMSSIAERMPESMIFLPDGTEIERKQGADRKAWDHKGLAVEVATKIAQMAVDMDTGEVTLTPHEMMIKMLDYAAPSYWRVGELGKIGVNPNNYCETSEGKVSVVIKKGKL
jgi:hypothetical protein